MDNIFLQISILLGITVSIAFIMRLFRQPLVVAYIVAGLIAGPLFLNIVNGETALFNSLAQFGIVLLLFILGLGLNFEYIKRIGKVVFAGGAAQFVITALAGLVVMRLFGFSWTSAMFVAIAITFSSTIIVGKLLSEKKDVETVYGKYVIGLLVAQDIIAVILLILLDTFQLERAMYNTIIITIGKGLILGSGVYFMSKFLLPFIIQRVAASGEMLFIFTIAWCFGVASLVYALGFGVEIGAVIAGISLGSSPYQAEISSRIKPLRDFFIVLFFIVLGSELQLTNITTVVWPGLILTAFVLIVDPIILYFIMRRMGYKRRSAFLAGVTAAQVSEFGFILIFKGEALGYLHGPELALLTIIALATIFISSYLITYNEQIYQWLRPWLDKLGKEEEWEENDARPVYPVWVFGYHRIGWKVCEALAQEKIPFAVVDFNPETVMKLKSRGIPTYFGDAADIEFLEDLPLAQAKLIISTIPAADDQKILIRQVRKVNSAAIIIASLHYAHALQDLYDVGANYVMLTHLLGGQWMADVLKHYPWTKKTFVKLRKEQREEMKLRYTLRVH